jgi:dCTP deaminase
MLNSIAIKNLIQDSKSDLGVAPMLDSQKLSGGDASIDLRLGCWFIQLRTERYSEFDFASKSGHDEDFLTQKTYVPFGKKFVLHPNCFILAATLEWVKIPSNLGGYVTGKSSLGRRGLVIETAPGVHPGFLGCLTLELANIGEVPLSLHPGMPVCQLFLHEISSVEKAEAKTRFRGERQPKLGVYTPDPIMQKLQEGRAATASRIMKT